MSGNSHKEFYAENEKHINLLLGKLFLLSVISGPIMIFFRFINVFPGISYSLLIITSILCTVTWIVVNLMNRHNPYSRATKYICIGSVQVVTFMLSITPYLAVFIGYLIVPILCSIYFYPKFSRRVYLVSWISMIISFIVRSKTNLPDSPVHITEHWLISFCAGNSLEFLICVVILYSITTLIKNALDTQYIQYEKILSMQKQLIIGIANLVESKDITTAKHVERTSRYVNLISKALVSLGYYTDELTDSYIELMTKAAPLHDIGKMYISEYILSKPTCLSPEEMNTIQLHPLFGEKIIVNDFGNVETEDFTQTAFIMSLCHHEWWNGHGYPLHLIEDEIPLCARIMAAADVIDALLNVRSYKPAFSKEKTLQIITEGSGTQFDPKIVEAVLCIQNKL